MSHGSLRLYVRPLTQVFHINYSINASCDDTKAFQYIIWF